MTSGAGLNPEPLEPLSWHLRLKARPASRRCLPVLVVFRSSDVVGLVDVEASALGSQDKGWRLRIAAVETPFIKPSA